MDDIADTTELLTAARAIGTGKEKKLQHLQERSTVLQSLNMSKAQLGKKRGVYIKPIPIGTPIDPKRQRIYTDEAKTRRDTATSKALTKSIGEDADPDCVARALDACGLLAPLMETPLFYQIRIEQGQELIDRMNSSCGTPLMPCSLSLTT